MYSNAKKETEEGVVLVPYYIEDALKANDIDMDDFVDVLYNRDDDKLLSKISKNDINDMLLLNCFFSDNMYYSDNHISPPCYMGMKTYDGQTFKEREKEYTRVLEDLSSGSLTYNQHHDGEFRNNSLFTMTHDNGVTKVIVYKGFTDFIKFNDEEFKYHFLKELVNFKFTILSDTSVFNSIFFYKFISLTKHKITRK